MKNYSLEFATGESSTMPMNRDKIIEVINYWIDKSERWSHIKVINNKTNQVELISQDAVRGHISRISI